MNHYKIEYEKNGEEWIFHCEAESKLRALEQFRLEEHFDVRIIAISELD